MAVDVPYISGQADEYVIPGLTSQADTKLFITNPTLAAGDFKIWNPSTLLWDNLTTLPAVLSAAGTAVRVSWSAAEANYEPFVIVWRDAAGAQWASGGLYGRMTLHSIDDLSTLTQAQILSDATPFAGANINATISGIPLAVWTYVSRTLTSISPALLGSIAAAVWTYTYRTLTMSLASLLTALKGTDIAVDRGDTMILDITGLGDLTGYTELWFTIKDDLDKTDPQSILQVLLSAPPLATDGLQAIAGVSPTAAANGSITVSSMVLGNITVRTEAIETAKLLDCGGFYYDIQKATLTDVFTIRRGRATIRGDVTRSI